MLNYHQSTAQLLLIFLLSSFLNACSSGKIVNANRESSVAAQLKVSDQKVVSNDQCPVSILFDGQEIFYDASDSQEYIVKLTDENRSQDQKKMQRIAFSPPKGTRLISYNARQNYALVKLGNKFERSAFLKLLKDDDAVAWVQRHCQPKRGLPICKSPREACTGLGALASCRERSMPDAHQPSQILRSSSGAIVDDQARHRVLDALNYFEVDHSRNITVRPPTVAVFDNRFNLKHNALKNTAATFSINGSNTTSWNYCSQQAKVESQPSKFEHGTKVARIVSGVCGSKNCKKGVGQDEYKPGVSPQARLFSAQVFSTINLPVGMVAMADAVNDAADLGVDIVNMSFTFKCKDGVTSCGEGIVGDAMAQASGTLFVVGNNDPDYPRYPAAFDFENVIAVQGAHLNLKGYVNSAMRSWKKRNDLAAPGNPHGLGIGVSFGIPLVSGAAALVLSNPNCRDLKPKDLRELLMLRVSQALWLPGQSLETTNRSRGYLDFMFLGNQDELEVYCSHRIST